MRHAALFIALTLATVSAAAGPPADWRRALTLHDRKRLTDWRTAWTAGLADARAGGGAATIAADPVLFDPDRAFIDADRIDVPVPPVADYRCRRVALGARLGAPPLTIEPWGRCRVDDGGDGPRLLTGLDGVQHLYGAIYPDTDRRAIFLGTTVFADEHRPAAYGHAAGRDMAGVIERIAEGRWRLVLPYPPFGGAVALIELRTASR